MLTIVSVPPSHGIPSRVPWSASSPTTPTGRSPSSGCSAQQPHEPLGLGARRRPRRSPGCTGPGCEPGGATRRSHRGPRPGRGTSRSGGQRRPEDRDRPTDRRRRRPARRRRRPGPDDELNRAHGAGPGPVETVEGDGEDGRDRGHGGEAEAGGPGRPAPEEAPDHEIGDDDGPGIEQAEPPAERGRAGGRGRAVSGRPAAGSRRRSARTDSSAYPRSRGASHPRHVGHRISGPSAMGNSPPPVADRHCTGQTAQ